MRKLIKITNMLGLIFIILLFIPRSSSATTIYIPGTTDEEASINQSILNTRDDYEVAKYLIDGVTGNTPVVRKTAAMRLGIIGTAGRLPLLQNAATTDTDREVRTEAAFSLWKLRYKEAVRSGGNLETFLLPAINIYKTETVDKNITFDAAPVPFTPNNDGGNWVVQNGVYKQLAEGEHISVLNDTTLETGTVEAKIKFDNYYNEAVLYFRTDEYGGGYALEVYVAGWNSNGWHSTCNLGLYPLTADGDIDWSGVLSSSSREGFDITTWHTLKVTLSDNSIEGSLDEGAGGLNVTSDIRKSKGKIALGSRGVASFDDLKVTGQNIVRDYSDVTKTTDVIAWAMGLLGDMGSTNAQQYLNAIINDYEIAPDSTYLKEKAQDNLDKIGFITSFTAGTSRITMIEQGLTHEKLCIRDWGLRMLIKENPADLKARLEALLEQADGEFAFRIQLALEELKWKEENPPLEFIYPSDGDTVKSRVISVEGRSYGQFFSETIEFNPDAEGKDTKTITKTIKDEDGNDVTKSLTIHYYNLPPVFNNFIIPPATVGRMLTFTVSAIDPNGDSLFYYADDEASNWPQGAVFNSNTHTFTWTPQAVGTYPVKFFVMDSYGLATEKIVNINVVQLIPKITGITPAVTFIGGTITITGECFGSYTADPNYTPYADIERDGIVDFQDNFALKSAYGSHTGDANYNPRADTNGDGVVDTMDESTVENAFGSRRGTSYVEFPNGIEAKVKSWYANMITCEVPPRATSGAVYVTTAVGRSNGFAARVNRPPVINPIPDQTITEGQLLQFTISAYDPDGDLLRYSALNLPRGAAFSYWDHRFSWRPLLGQAGTYQVTFNVTDGKVNVSKTVNITVAALPPVITYISPTISQPGRYVYISGNNFGLTLGRVQFSGQRVSIDANIISWTNTSIRCLVPQLLAGDYNIKVITAKGTESSPKSLKVITYPPSISWLWPYYGIREGQLITIYGNYFGQQDANSAVKISGPAGSYNAVILSWTDTRVVFKAPKLNRGSYQLKVSNRQGISNYRYLYY